MREGESPPHQHLPESRKFRYSLPAHSLERSAREKTIPTHTHAATSSAPYHPLPKKSSPSFPCLPFTTSSWQAKTTTFRPRTTAAAADAVREEEEEAAANRAFNQVSKFSKASEVKVRLSSPSANRGSLLLTKNFNKDSPLPQVNSLLRSARFLSASRPDAPSAAVSPLSKLPQLSSLLRSARFLSASHPDARSVAVSPLFKDSTLVPSPTKYLPTVLLKRRLLPPFPSIATDLVSSNLPTAYEHSPRLEPRTCKLSSGRTRRPPMPLFLKPDELLSPATLMRPRLRPKDSPPFRKPMACSTPLPAPSTATSDVCCTVIASTNFAAAEAPPRPPRPLVETSVALLLETFDESQASSPATPRHARPGVLPPRPPA